MTIDLKRYLQDRGQNFNDIRVLAHIPRNQIAAVCGVHPATVRRWKAQNSYPEWAYKLVGYHAGFFIHKGWQGWYIDDGLLYPPQHVYGFTPNDVEMLGWMRAELDTYRPQFEKYKCNLTA